MTPTQIFLALINALRTQPEADRVDQLLADLAAISAARLHDTKATTLRLACLRIPNPEPLIAADLLLRHYGFTLTAARHQTAHLISIKRHTEPDAAFTATVRTRTATEGAQAA